MHPHAIPKNLHEWYNLVLGSLLNDNKHVTKKTFGLRYAFSPFFNDRHPKLNVDKSDCKNPTSFIMMLSPHFMGLGIH